MKRVYSGLSRAFFLLLNLVSVIAISQQSVVMQHNDNNRTGWYSQEKSLTVNNVRNGSFGKLFERVVDDQVYAQPLVAAGLIVPGLGQRNIVIIATVNNSVYAFDADSASVSNPYWQVNLTAPGSRVIRNTDMTGACGGGYRDFSGNMGIVGTPVIDTSTLTIYVVARSLNTSTNTYTQYLHALDLGTGAEKAGSPKLITATVNGNGDGSVNGKISFDAQKQNQRPGLLLANGIVYIAWSSHCDWGPYHGWIIGYDQATLEQKVVYNSTPEGYNGGIWMSGAAPALDENGNLYVAVGNGSVGFNNNPSDPVNRSESALKLTPSNGTLNVASFFSPSNINDLEAADLDFGVTEMMLIPGTTRVMTSCKDGKIYLLDRDSMGGFSAITNNVVQTINLGTNAHLRSSFAYYKGAVNEYVYSWSENALLKAFPYDRATNSFNLANTVSSGAQGPVGNNGAFLAVSSNGSADSSAVLWAAFAANGDANQSVRPGILRAFDANDVTKELWNSSTYLADNPGNYAKFNCPVIANGKVYLGTFSNKLVVYGLLKGASADTCNSVNIAVNKAAVASSVADAVANPAAAAFDGNVNTAWVSQSADPQSIYVDLGKRYDLCRVILRWQSVAGKDFSIQLSDDAVNWNPIINMTGNSDTANSFALSGTCRYVRIAGTARNGSGGYALSEFEVYGKLSAFQCAAPVALNVTDIYENSATIHWSGSGAAGYDVQFKAVSAPDWNAVYADSNFLKLNNLACASDYLFRIRNICGASDTSQYSVSSSFSTLPCNSNCGPLPTRWTTQDIGDVDAAGSACYSNGIFELAGSGIDIWDTEDGFRFAYKTFVGDGEIKARVLSLDQSNEWNKCGIMIRESLAPGSRHAFIALTSGNGVAFQNRLQTDATSNSVNTGPGIVAPYWIKLGKKGSVYTAFSSADGNVWTQIGDPVDAGFGDGVPVYSGLALTSHYNGILSRAMVDNYSLGGFLQLELQSFTAALSLDKTVALQWVTTLETNIQQYVVERSTDNKNYAPLDSLNGVNNGRFTQTYNLNDKHPNPVNYYRLRITNFDGSTSYSAPVFIRIGSDKSPLIFPNPAGQAVHIARGTEAIKIVNVYDISGRFMKSINNAGGLDILELPVYSFANGIYVLEIRTEGTVFREKLVVAN